MKKLYLAICFLIAVAGIAGVWFYLETQRPSPRISGANVLAIIAQGFDYPEYIGVVDILKEEGAAVTTASFTNTTVSGHKPDITFDEVDLSIYDIIFIPGGDGPYNIISHRDSQKVFDILAQGCDEDKIIAAICHGPWVLAAADLVNGSTVTCTSDQAMIDDLKAHGATVDTSKGVIRDANIITARGQNYINALAKEIIAVHTEKHGE